MSWAQQSAEFWSREVPGTHFRTPARLQPLAAAVSALAARHGLTRVVDLGAGDGTLLSHLSAVDPDLELVGVDLREGTAPGGGSWVRIDPLPPVPRELRGALAPPRTLLVLVELLDEIPGPVVKWSRGRWRQVARTSTGLSEADAGWLDRWWPGPTGAEGDAARAVVGRERDQLWAELLRALGPGGIALAVDYGHDRMSRPRDGGLQVYRHGHREPAPVDLDQLAATANLSASVAMDSVRAAGEATGARTVADSTLADGVREWRSASEGSGARGLLQRGQWAELTDERGFGGFRWLCQQAPADGTEQ